jgi:magnesium chelatase subunit I
LDLQQALQQGSVEFRPGLLARAHEGVLYVDEVNLLADHLVDVLLDAAASGINHVERDGVSHQHDARFVLIGTMNPEEGELRPQLLDRFGLFIDLSPQLDIEARQRIVKTRMAFDDNPAAFVAAYAAQQEAYRQCIRSARACIAELAFSDEIHQRVANLCAEAQAEGVRGDLVLLRAARAHAALHQKSRIEASDVEQVADWVLRHRRKAVGEANSSATQSSDPDSSTANESTANSQAAAPSGAGHDTTTNAADNEFHADQNAEQVEVDWGALPPQPVALTPVKTTGPISTKKR